MKQASSLNDRGRVIAICGPDGVGKSTVVESLAGLAGGPVLNIHHRPGVLPYPIGVDQNRDYTQPHLKALFSKPVSAVKVAYLYLDWLVAWIVRLYPHRRGGGWVLIQRPWWDMVVDPLRYRLNLPLGLIQILGRFLPAPDLTVLLKASPDVIKSRKSELSDPELIRQIAEWDRVIVIAGGQTIDAEGTVESCASAIVESVNQDAMPPMSSIQEGRWLIPRKPRKATVTATNIYQPVDRRGSLLSAAAQVVAASGLARTLPTSSVPPDLIRLIRPWIPQNGTFAAQRLRRGDRWFVLTIASDGSSSNALKVGISDEARESLAREGKTLESIRQVLALPLDAPILRESVEGVLVMDPIEWIRRRDPLQIPDDVAIGLGNTFRKTMIRSPEGPSGTIHGDLAPWNILWDGSRWFLIDWEHSRPYGSPFYDILHHFVQSHALIGRPTAQTIINGLRGKGPVGQALTKFADAANVDIEMSATVFPEYLRGSAEQLDPAGVGYQRAVAKRNILKALWRQAEKELST